MSLVGVTLSNKYRLDKVLGEGGMATVYAATHVRNAVQVAVKVLHPKVAKDSDLRKRFLREGYLANTVGHPGTVRVLDDAVTDDGEVYLVMDLLEGRTLDARDKLSPHALLPLLCELLNILDAAHAKGIVHRDIKPENLFLTKDGDLKVLDFGIAKMSGPSLTTGTFGTPAFMPPEQAIGQGVNHLSDVWAVGATAFTLLSGKTVHRAKSIGETLLRIATKPAPLLHTVMPNVPPGLAQVIDKALSFEKKDRWQSAKAMRAALLHVDLQTPIEYAETMQVRTKVLRPEAITLSPLTLSPTPASRSVSLALPALTRTMTRAFALVRSQRKTAMRVLDAAAIVAFLGFATRARGAAPLEEVPTRAFELPEAHVALEASAPRELTRLVPVTSLPRAASMPSWIRPVKKDPLAP